MKNRAYQSLRISFSFPALLNA